MLMKSRIYQIVFALLAIFCVQDSFAQGAFDENKQRPIDDAIIGGATMRTVETQVVVDEIITDFETDEEGDDRDSIDGTVNLNGLTNNEFDMFPNPANSVVTMVMADRADYEIKIYDLSGRLIFAEFHNQINSISLDIGDFPSSLYIVHIEGINLSETKKLKVSR